jgi:hypothetical protein
MESLRSLPSVDESASSSESDEGGLVSVQVRVASIFELVGRAFAALLELVAENVSLSTPSSFSAAVS